MKTSKFQASETKQAFALYDSLVGEKSIGTGKDGNGNKIWIVSYEENEAVSPLVDLLGKLRTCAESVTTYADGSLWTDVYLPNVEHKGMTNHQFAGYLSTLEKQGLYKTVDGEFFGSVKL